MLNEEVYIGLWLQLKKNVHILPQEESCHDLPLLDRALPSTAFSRALVSTRCSLERVPYTQHKAIPMLFPHSLSGGNDLAQETKFSSVLGEEEHNTIFPVLAS